ncbi:Uncharacterised protein [Salmonella enterica subsp. arizonae]|nr:Uncharacterised protein [Salmonella enterica subsp. arizonae]
MLWLVPAAFLIGLLWKNLVMYVGTFRMLYVLVWKLLLLQKRSLQKGRPTQSIRVSDFLKIK